MTARGGTTADATTTGALTIRLLEPAERARAATALERWDEVMGSLASTYPQVLGRRAQASRFGVFDGDRLVSHAAAHCVRIHAGADTTRVTLIGSVATDPEHRRRGLASDLLRHVIAVAAGAGCDALLLWSDRWEFYERLGFLPAGVQLELVLRGPAARPAVAELDGIRRWRPDDLEAILALHQRKPIAVGRFAADLEILLSARPMDTVVLERGGQVVAYACHGKGIDFDGWWHEVGGADEDVARLLPGAMQLLGLDRATLLVPPYRAGLLEPLEPYVELAHEGVSGLVLPLTERGCTPLFVDGLDSI